MPKIQEKINMKRFFEITSVSRDDLREYFKTDPEALKRVNAMTDEDMKFLAEQMADDYTEQLFWDSLRERFKERFLNEHEEIIMNKIKKKKIEKVIKKASKNIANWVDLQIIKALKIKK